jgi:hypothetical protein
MAYTIGEIDHKDEGTGKSQSTKDVVTHPPWRRDLVTKYNSLQ